MLDTCQVGFAVMDRRRLEPAARRDELIAAGAELFAARPYDAVRMDEVARRAGASRALLYRYFPAKRDLFEAVYREAAARLLDASPLRPELGLYEQLTAALDAHLDYFAAHRHAVLAANRVLAGDPVIQAVIGDELAVLRDRLVEATGLTGRTRELFRTALAAWLVYVRVLCVSWLAEQRMTRDELRAMCLGALHGSLRAVDGLDVLGGPVTPGAPGRTGVGR